MSFSIDIKETRREPIGKGYVVVFHDPSLGPEVYESRFVVRRAQAEQYRDALRRAWTQLQRGGGGIDLTSTKFGMLRRVGDGKGGARSPQTRCRNRGGQFARCGSRTGRLTSRPPAGHQASAPIKVRYRSIDGYSKSAAFKTLEGARRFAVKWVGARPEVGSFYAVSWDGVGRVTVEGVSIRDLFPAG